MKQTKTLIITVLMITLLLSSYVAFATEYGSKDDPLVSLSYIKEILLPQALESIDDIVEEKTNAYVSQLDSKFENFGSEFETVAENQDFIDKVAQSVINSQNLATLVTLSSGQSISFNSGTEFLLRTGSASLASSTGTVNATTGIVSQTSIIANNLYIAVEDYQTLSASEATTIMVFGSYTLN